MRFRFAAATKDGESRRGYVEAEDEDQARRQLERRGLNLESLEQDFSEVPIALRNDTSTVLVAEENLSPQKKWELPDWRHVDWKRLGAALVVLSLVGWGCWWALGKILADRTYHLRLVGQYHLNVRRKMPKNFWKKVHPRLFLPRPGWFVTTSGVIYAKGSDGRWKPQERQAQVKYTGTLEGNYTMDIEIALPAIPEGCSVDITAPGFLRVRRRAMFKVKNDALVCEVPTMVLQPRRKRSRKRRSAKGGTNVP